MNTSKILLIIEDDYDLRTTLADLLESELPEYAIMQAEDGVQGLAKIKDFNPDVIICDNQMPHMKGFEVVQELNTQGILVNQFFLYTGDHNPPKLVLHGKPVEIWQKPKSILEMVEAIIQTSKTKAA